MERLNKRFQVFMKETGFPLKIIEEEVAFKYRGRLSLSPNEMTDFSILLPKSLGTEVVQIVFEKIGVIDQQHSREEWLCFINRMNCELGIHYYFCLREDGIIFARYVFPVQPSNVSIIYDLIRVGSGIIRQFITQMETTFPKQ
ncbi:TPA: hypothetical protein TXV04_001058 [Streptococcus suis]|uniref:hypothetical protein n=1 Tax=Streptococcus suis TaxID=1307 RepID=UPI002118AC44|nr:hypothetical protein [Streptococcus suis]MCQ8263807.1 hypothetical protein [Streptococcus suis]HEL1662461.1 hypothetical protein [Streptococcus suis]HEL1767949.1 hypothetical protein [Streptococcus suis]HEL1972936.1 hypothetical protein [Streptococcus suis]HEL2729267.1 hypothetical protein [Streptococcus suis]